MDVLTLAYFNVHCTQVQERSDLCSTGREQLSSYADVSVPFNSWLKLAEEKGKDFSTLPRSKEELLRRQEEVREFHSDVSEHGEALDGVETKGCSFLSTAKVRCLICTSQFMRRDVLAPWGTGFMLGF